MILWAVIMLSSQFHLLSVNKMFPYHYAGVILCSVEDVIIFEHGCYISALEQIRMLLFSSYFLLACINTIYKYGHTG